MTTLTRRAFVQGLAALPLAMGALPQARAATTYMRYDCASPQGLQMLEIYAGAVRQMQAMGPDNPMSWMWQWYTHFVNGATTKAAEIDRVFGTAPSTGRSLADETWNTCQSHAGQNSNHFLPWHRMFVFYFERIVRQVSGRPDFTLPYWDYTSTDPAKRGIVPEPFRLPSDPVFDCLYVAARTSLANGGSRIDRNQPTDVMDISDAMSKASYTTVGSEMGFCRAIDSGIHGRIHTLVGNSRNMGAVPYAGNDPLFWVHHANIDRMWASWNKNGGKNPTDATQYPWINNQFVFVDASGARVQRPLKNYFSALSLGYDYDSFIPKPRTTTTTTASASTLAATSAARVSPQQVARIRAGLDLGARPTSGTLEPVSTARKSSVLGLDDSRTGGRAYLVLKDLHTWAQPEVLFHVYLHPGRGVGPLDKAHYVGNINFFDAEFHDHGNAKMDMALGENFYSFDVTDLLESFRRAKAPAARDALAVTIVPAGRPSGGQPMVGSIELVRQ